MTPKFITCVIAGALIGAQLGPVIAHFIWERNANASLCDMEYQSYMTAQNVMIITGECKK